MTDPLITELIEARKAAGLTQRQVADRMHCVQSHVSMLEAGRTDLQLDTLRRWAGALGLRPVWVPETAPATSVVAGNGAPRLGEGAADEDAPASDPADVGSDEGRADVAPCNDCGVGVCAEHTDGCDVARCLVTGFQRLSCGEDHDCGGDVWTGKWPGVAECEALGWWAYFVPHTGFVPCAADHPGAVADLNRLVLEGVWDRDAKRWTHPAVARTLDVAEATADKARAVGLARSTDA